MVSRSLSLFPFHSSLSNFSFSFSLSFSHVYAVCSRNPKNVRRSWTEYTHTHVQSCTAQLGNCTIQKSLVPFLHLQSEHTQLILSGFPPHLFIHLSICLHQFLLCWGSHHIIFNLSIFNFTDRSGFKSLVLDSILIKNISLTEGALILRKWHNVESLFHVNSRDYTYAVCVRR